MTYYAIALKRKIFVNYFLSERRGIAIETYEDSYHDGKVATNNVWSSTGNKSERLKEATSQVLQVNLFNFLVACRKLAVKAVPASWKTSCAMSNLHLKSILLFFFIPRPISNSHLRPHNCINVFV